MDLILSLMFAITPNDGSCYKVIDSSNIQEFLELKKDKKMNISNILKISKFRVMRLTENQKNQ